MSKNLGFIPQIKKEMGVRSSGLVVADADPEKLLQQLIEARQFNAENNDGQKKETNDDQLGDLIEKAPAVIEMRDRLKNEVVLQHKTDDKSFGFIHTLPPKDSESLK